MARFKRRFRPPDESEHLELTKEYNQRLWVLYAVLIVCLAMFTGALYTAQIVNGAAYYAQSSSRIPVSETVEASRGILIDRNGKVLVSNRQIYTITFDSSKLKDGTDPNEAILRLITLCEEHGVAWEDNLPVSRNLPFSYTLDEFSDTLQSRFEDFLRRCGDSAQRIGADIEQIVYASVVEMLFYF